MNNLGIICNDSLDVVGHSLFNNFRLALKNHFNQPFKDINNANDLRDINTLFIVDEHFYANVPIWKNDEFIKTANLNNIKVVVFNFEKIYSSQFPWNEDHQKKLEEFKHLYQIVSDVDDAARLNKKIINKQFLSRDTKLETITTNKSDRILFIGQCNGYYPTRKHVLSKITSKGLPIDICITDRKLSYTEFLSKLSAYKYILNPLGTGKFLNLRFYEALKLGCIPIQELTQNMSSWYDELNYSYNFIDADQITLEGLKEFEYKTFNSYLEDYFDSIDLKKIIL